MIIIITCTNGRNKHLASCVTALFGKILFFVDIIAIFINLAHTITWNDYYGGIVILNGVLNRFFFRDVECHVIVGHFVQNQNALAD